MIELIGFGLVAASLLFCGLQVVTTKNMVHTVLWLGLSLAMTSALYVMLHAPFMAAIQLLLYTGGVLTLMLFGLMLTRRSGLEVDNVSHKRRMGFVTASTIFGIFAVAVLKTDSFPTAVAATASVKQVGEGFLTTHLLAFELLSFLLLAVVVGAIVLARTHCPDGTPQSPTSRIPARRREHS